MLELESLGEVLLGSQKVVLDGLGDLGGLVLRLRIGGGIGQGNIF